MNYLHTFRRCVSKRLLQALLFTLVLVLCSSCAGSQAADLGVATPTATIAVVPIMTSVPLQPTRTPPPQPSPTPPPTSIPVTVEQAGDANAGVAASFEYLWPGYLPEGMLLAPRESRVAQADETGAGGLGFYIVTFNATGQKLAVGGGATDHMPMAGEQRRITIGDRAAVLMTDGVMRQVVFRQPQGSLFVYGFGVSEEELLRVAESLTPLPVEELRERVDEA